jgi:hypothetical protein
MSGAVYPRHHLRLLVSEKIHFILIFRLLRRLLHPACEEKVGRGDTRRGDVKRGDVRVSNGYPTVIQRKPNGYPRISNGPFGLFFCCFLRMRSLCALSSRAANTSISRSTLNLGGGGGDNGGDSGGDSGGESGRDGRNGCYAYRISSGIVCAHNQGTAHSVWSLP